MLLLSKKKVHSVIVALNLKQSMCILIQLQADPIIETIGLVDTGAGAEAFINF